MTDIRTRKQKLVDMAGQTASPKEARNARRKLNTGFETMFPGATDRPKGTYLFEDRTFRGPTATMPKSIRDRLHARSVQLLASFPNGYGASVIQGPFSYGGDTGLYELAVLHGPKEDLCYASPITADVVGYLTQDGVMKLLHAVADLPQMDECTHFEPGHDPFEAPLFLPAGTKDS